MKRENFINALIYLLALLIILQCYSLLSMILSNGLIYLSILVIMSTLLILENKIRIERKYIYLIIFYSICMAILFINPYFVNLQYICCVYLASPLFILYAANKEKAYKLFNAYTNIMAVIAALSLFFFLFATTLNLIQPTGFYPQSQIQWGPNNYYDYYHLYNEGQKASALGYEGTRNIAIFLEGPMLAYTISLALYYELFIRKTGPRKYVVIIILFTILTSLSTTGIIVAIALLFAKFYLQIRKYKTLRYVFLPLICVIALLGIRYVIIDKYVSNFSSTSVRIDDVLTCLKCFSKNMITGVGYQNMEALDEFRTIARAGSGLSTGIGAILAFGGLLWGSWYLIPIFLAIWQFIFYPNTRPYTGFVLLASFLLLLTVVETRILCTAVNSLCWLIVLNKNIRLKGVKYE